MITCIECPKCSDGVLVYVESHAKATCGTCGYECDYSTFIEHKYEDGEDNEK